MHSILLAHADGTVKPDHGSQSWAHAQTEKSPFHAAALIHPTAARTILWSGTPADHLFERDLRAWRPEAWDHFTAWCQTHAPTLRAADRRILWRPHARHVLSDVQRCLRVMATWDADAFGLVLDAPSLLESPMLPKAPDHIQRAFDTLGSRADAVWIHSVQPAPDPEDDSPLTSDIPGQGIPDVDLLARMIRDFVPPAIPLIFPSRTPPSVIAVLAPSRYT